MKQSRSKDHRYSRHFSVLLCRYHISIKEIFRFIAGILREIIYLLTTGLTPSGSSTVHIYTQKIYGTTKCKQNKQNRTYITIRIQKHNKNTIVMWYHHKVITKKPDRLKGYLWQSLRHPGSALAYCVNLLTWWGRWLVLKWMSKRNKNNAAGECLYTQLFHWYNKVNSGFKLNVSITNKFLGNSRPCFKNRKKYYRM